MIKKSIVWFREVGKDDVALVGGKGANLGEMINAGLPIPYGFIITASAYFKFIKETKLEEKIKSIINLINYDNPDELRQASLHLRQLIEETPFPKYLAQQIIEYYDNLVEKENEIIKKTASPLFLKIKQRIKQLYKQPYLAVRSSATAEDLPTASFAGQQETFLNVRGENNLIKKVKLCWSSLFTERAIYYRHQQGFDKFKVGLAVVCQRMVQSEKSGIAFSLDPVTNDKQKIVIEAILGLGEYIVGGKVTPDHYEVDKRSFLILKKEVKYQNLKLTRVGLNNIETKLSPHMGKQQKISDAEIIKIAMLVKQIEEHYYFPQDIEWAIENENVFIVQSRPITTLNQKSSSASKGKDQKETTQLNTNEVPILIGSPASPGMATGPVKIIYSPQEIDQIKKGDILVAPQTNPDYVPAMKKAVAIITEKGGRTSHAAIVSRELGIPAVVGAEAATKKLKNEMIVTVKGQTGEVFKGKLHLENSQSVISSSKMNNLMTLTKVYVNLAEPEEAEKIAKENVDGVGLLRAEFMIADIGIHPKEFIRQKKEKIFINKLTKDLLKFVKPFNGRPVIYRATDFKTNEYRHLIGGAKYEPKEENPMLGFRGASRYIVNPDVFNLELQAIANVWQVGYQNLHLMIPFLRAPWELVKIKEIIKKAGLFSLPNFRLLIMVEVPAAALGLEEFLKIGVDGISIGTNDLTMMTLGVDRDNAEVANIYDERNPVIIDLLKKIVELSRKYQVTSSICGQAASDYPEIVEALIKAGITSVSVNPDAINRTRELIHNIEKKHLKR
jgi:pyruvate,water dikinase